MRPARAVEVTGGSGDRGWRLKSSSSVLKHCNQKSTETNYIQALSGLGQFAVGGSVVASEVLCSHVLRELVDDIELPGKDEALGAILGLSDPFFWVLGDLELGLSLELKALDQDSGFTLNTKNLPF